MEYSFFIVIPNEIEDHMTLLLNQLKRDVINHLNKSIRVYIDSGHASSEHSDFFVRNQTGYWLFGRSYRVPRIVKSSLLKRREAVEKGIKF